MAFTLVILVSDSMLDPAKLVPNESILINVSLIVVFVCIRPKDEE